MCGISGYIGKKRAAPRIVEMLRLLEYRGYDSVGIATMDSKGYIRISKGVGSIDSVLKKKPLADLPGSIGIGHTRRSTHGKVSEQNAHPHIDCSRTIALVHNGVIQNFLEIKRSLPSHNFVSETDTEVVAHLLEEIYSGDFLEALREALQKLEGDFAIALLHSPERRIYFMKRGLMPLIIGLGEGENYIASDVVALLPYTKRVIYVEDGQYGYVSEEEVAIYNAGKKIEIEVKEVDIDLSLIDKGGFAHRMHKEIYDIPDFSALFVNYKDSHVEEAKSLIEAHDKIRIIGAGTSYHASLYGEYLLSRKYPKKSFKAIIASEFPNFLDLVSDDDLIIAVSQSGETYDVLEPVRRLKERGLEILAIVNRRNSALDRLSDARLYIEAGIERAVAATKTFVNQVLAFMSLSGIEIDAMPKLFERILKERRDRGFGVKEKLDELALRLSKRLSKKENMFYLGRYLGYVIAKEGALKIKEVAYIHAEAYPSGELKHGPLALISKSFPVVVLSYSERHVKKDRSTVEEVSSRGAEPIIITVESLEEYFPYKNKIVLPDAPEELRPLELVIPAFLIAYHTAVLRGHDPDKPRNLAKSVTVE